MRETDREDSTANLCELCGYPMDSQEHKEGRNPIHLVWPTVAHDPPVAPRRRGRPPKVRV